MIVRRAFKPSRHRRLKNAQLWRFVQGHIANIPLSDFLIHTRQRLFNGIWITQGIFQEFFYGTR